MSGVKNTMRTEQVKEMVNAGRGEPAIPDEVITKCWSDRGTFKERPKEARVWISG